MQQRAFERVPANINIRFYTCDTDYSGTIKNISESGMFISTDKMLFPFDSTIEIIVPFEEKLLKVPVKVVRMTKTDDVFDGIGVELLDNHQDYLALVNSLKDVSA
jgi:Tfp pilus assembly protein PilZ